jgi:hypothetical protein
MKVHLRHANKKWFYCGWHNWTADTKLAIDFATLENAIQRACDEKLAPVEAVVFAGETIPQQVVPIGLPRPFRPAFFI